MWYAGRTLLNATAILALVGVVGCRDQAPGPSGPSAISMDIVSGNQQWGDPGQMLADPLVVRVTNSSGAPVSGQIVNFVVTSGNGTVFAGSAISRSDGLVKERWTLGTNTSQAQRVEARAVDTETGAPQTFATFTAQFGTPPAPVATVEVAPSSASIQTGNTVQLTATTKDAGGTVLTGRTVTWTTSNASVATVSSTGLVTAVAAGAATITATSETKTGTSAITVTAPAPPGNSLDVQLIRFDGGSGLVTLSSGVPLPPGWLQPGSVGNVRLTVGGAEQAVYVQTLAKHTDGSVRTLLVQTRYSVGGTPVAARILLGSARQTTDLAKQTVNWGQPAAAILPTSAAYLVSTDLVGPTTTATATAAMGSSFQQWDANFATYANQHWSACGAQWDCGYGDYYDRAIIYYAMWVRTANPEYWRRGTAQALNYRQGYLQPAGYGSSPHWSQLRGVAMHYLVTGDNSSRTAVAGVANALYGGGHEWLNQGHWDNRQQARLLESYILAYRLEDTSRNWAVAMDEALNDILGTQAANGRYPLTWECSETLPYMVGMLNESLMDFHRYYRADSRIPSSIQRAADWLWTQWVPSEGGFRYIDVPCPSVGTTDAAPDLTLMIVTTFGWVYDRTGNSTYLTRGDQVWAGGVANAYYELGKQFNEAFTFSYRYPAQR